MTAELTELAMPHASLSAVLTELDEPGPFGADDVEIRLAAHPGAPPLPLQKGASGGELSRVMLAIEVVFAGADPVPTFVFDEVDAGVGGKAAVEIGRRLARLARSAQVIVVTHLPQVAAFADNHLVVEKSGDGLVIASGVTRLDQLGRIRELSRMLAGLEDSEYGQAHAEELLDMAADEAGPRLAVGRLSGAACMSGQHGVTGVRRRRRRPGPRAQAGRRGRAAGLVQPDGPADLDRRVPGRRASCCSCVTCGSPLPRPSRRTAGPTPWRRGTCCTATCCCTAGP